MVDREEMMVMIGRGEILGLRILVPSERGFPKLWCKWDRSQIVWKK